jgi:hypothetical protein
MAEDNNKNIMLSDEIVMTKIFVVRGQKVMIDRDLADLYGVETRVLKQTVRRNIERFPEDFMFEMTKEEFSNWRSPPIQISKVYVRLHFVLQNKE